MKRVLLCERSLKGHRKIYLEGLTGVAEMEFFCFAPENIGLKEDHYFKYEMPEGKPSLGGYLRWIGQIKNIVREHGIDVVHITDGDSIMRYFGLGFCAIAAGQIVITYHHYFPGFGRKLSYLAMNSGRRTISVVHTDEVKKKLISVGVKNVSLCKYPAFTFSNIADRNSADCKRYFGVPENVPVIGIIGGGIDYKNIVPFLETMRGCHDKNFHILICGKGNEAFINDVQKAAEPYYDKVTMQIKRLTDDEYEMFIAASDIIYCIYNHSFDGASGPLTDGVCAKKMILSCAHGSLGAIVTENHLGFTAECTDAEEILAQTEKAIESVGSFVYDNTARKYRESLMPEHFLATYKKIYDWYFEQGK